MSTRKIIITCTDLEGPSQVTLFLIFDHQPAMQGIYEDYFPVVWKTVTFPTKGKYAMTVTYKDRLVFINSQLENSKIANPTVWVDINPGQQTDLIKKDAVKFFTDPTIGEEGVTKATNKTDCRETISIGFDNGTIPPPSTLVFKNVCPAYDVTANFTPTLSIYISHGNHQEKAILWKRIHTRVIWRKNLIQELEETSYWTLKYDCDSKEYSITLLEDL